MSDIFLVSSAASVNWTAMWTTKGSRSGCRTANGWYANPPSGYLPVSMGWTNMYSPPVDQVVFVKNDPKYSAKPTGFSLLWTDAGSQADKDTSIWRMNAPDGYVALGCAISNSHNQPDANMWRCVRTECVKFTQKGDMQQLWSDSGCGSKIDARMMKNSEYATVVCNPDNNANYWSFSVNPKYMTEYLSALDASKIDGGKFASLCCSDGQIDRATNPGMWGACQHLNLRNSTGGVENSCSTALAFYCQGPHLEEQLCYSYCNSRTDHGCDGALGKHCGELFARDSAAALESDICANYLPNPFYQKLADALGKQLNLKPGAFPANPACVYPKAASASAIKPAGYHGCQLNLQSCTQTIGMDASGATFGGNVGIDTEIHCTQDIGGEKNPSPPPPAPATAPVPVPAPAPATVPATAPKTNSSTVPKTNSASAPKTNSASAPKTKSTPASTIAPKNTSTPVSDPTDETESPALIQLRKIPSWVWLLVGGTFVILVIGLVALFIRNKRRQQNKSEQSRPGATQHSRLKQSQTRTGQAVQSQTKPPSERRRSQTTSPHAIKRQRTQDK